MAIESRYEYPVAGENCDCLYIVLPVITLSGERLLLYDCLQTPIIPFSSDCHPLYCQIPL
ncbi:hypothetical protein SAMN05660461_3933 [Chitinophaga ginsengisegetis]|uniref:Uncharacterized protein n=1 Tax=Chitinophaga ginsengisegetis TaxID=393003 RepID=A0A1T5P5K1_9BACT|nr:hypothetical protein SAMN05660461_3933 [Chitinophaga ginsengisegetis]